MIIPTHDWCALTTQAIEGVLASVLVGNAEVIVVGDASTDANLTVLGERYGRDTPMRFLYSGVRVRNGLRTVASAGAGWL